MSKWVYFFGDGQAEGRADMKNLLGGKGANLAEMANLGIPVPAGFTITTEVCTYYYENGETYPSDLRQQVMDSVKAIETIMGATFGDAENPLLVSVRSGARTSMPGMMDTVLNLGLNDTTVQGLIARSGDARFAYDSYRRFVTMYSDVVLGVDHYHFEEILEAHKEDKGYTLDTEMTAEDWKTLVGIYKTKVKEQLGSEFPEDPVEQLWGAVGAVFGSWMNQRAKTYRRLHNIPGHWGTAVNVQAMVFGNMGEDCATGVCFTRDPSTGENAFYGEYLVNAQGEDVVAGIRTPQSISIAGRKKSGSDLPSMEETMPQTYTELVGIRDRLEKHYTDMQDMEFTIQKDKLWMLQTRNGKRTAAAALKIAVDTCNEGLIDKETAIMRVAPEQLDQLLHPMLDPDAPRKLLARGLPASPGAASGQVVFTADEAEDWVQKGHKVILVRVETSPEDIGGMHVSQGILTTRGGMTSHAAVVARGMGVPCVAGAGEIRVDANAKTMTVGGTVVKEGEIITLDGAKGEVFLGEVPTLQPELSGDFADLMEWADAVRRMKVRANAETPEDAATARKFGAEGIGLCRTEHMFFDPKRIIHIRQMILAEDEAGRRAALEHLLPYQRKDFVELFTIMQGLPITVRLLDPPLHEFLPHTDSEVGEVAKSAGVDVAEVKSRVSMLQEANPMLGHRGCRLGISYPEVYEMQARAIFEAAVEVSQTSGQTVLPEVMIPLVSSRRELELLRGLVDKVAKETFATKGTEIPYHVGTMIELPRACLQAGVIAEEAEFFSFGTNDLTQTTLGMSRDDSAPFLEVYAQKAIYPRDPFQSIDVDGVGEMVSIAAERGRATRPGIKLGICGEHGGDPSSIQFCEGVGLDYVSCSPYRVPIARLAAAQSVLLKGQGAEVDR
ncbi:pyruvate, phosphate dikinase [Roseospira visakhapatnamensis]|uniref:Pyruvate, phosphate dikinase n=1 Tax=Roseospira visakhapatnamensis TaxID=390880 RepID=A0A7W6RFA8_9PROT|nr:pyruvate, phosphate dikinase [Roseospira visakhapatnamensis]MBB4267489.1 pyruvate,orthophosphate dikinase [Roseospira visakhapatnamensis]